MTARARQRAVPWEWDIRESGPADADHTVLLLPGTLATYSPRSDTYSARSDTYSARSDTYSGLRTGLFRASVW
jgi:hypothetical protein